MNAAELVKKEVAAICDRKIAKLRIVSDDKNFRPIIRKRATQAIHHLQDIRFRWVESPIFFRN